MVVRIAVIGAQGWNLGAQPRDREVVDLQGPGGIDRRLRPGLIFAGRAEDWFDIYKALELAQSLAGGRSRRKLNALLGEARDEFERMWRTANMHRHARSKDPPTIPMTLAEAMSLLPFVIRSLLAHLVP